MPWPEDQYSVQELTSERSNGTFTDRIRPRRRLDDLGALGVENAIECQYFFGYPVGAENYVTSCDLGIFVDKAVGHVVLRAGGG